MIFNFASLSLVLSCRILLLFIDLLLFYFIIFNSILFRILIVQFILLYHYLLLHCFITLNTIRYYTTLYNTIQYNLVGTNRIGYALERSSMVSFDELCRQLAFYNSGDSGNFDVIILTFSLLSYWETSQSLWLSSFARGVISSTNMKLVESALRVIFASQAEDGTWVKGGKLHQFTSVSLSVSTLLVSLCARDTLIIISRYNFCNISSTRHYFILYTHSNFHIFDNFYFFKFIHIRANIFKWGCTGRQS